MHFTYIWLFFLFIYSVTYTVPDQVTPFLQHQDPASILIKAFPSRTQFFHPEVRGLPNQPGFCVDVVVKLDHPEKGEILVICLKF